MRIYISGRVTGLPREEAERKFAGAETDLRASNFDPVNPLRLVDYRSSRKDAMRVLLPVLLDCDSICLLDNWQWSEGAKIEYELARYAGMEIIFQDDLI